MNRMNQSKAIATVLISVLCCVLFIQCQLNKERKENAGDPTSFPPIRMNKTSYMAGDSAFFLISGEFHYFRVPEQDWRKRMQLFKEAGGNCIATYIPWMLHEPEEGKFLFGDTAVRDLEKYLRIAKEEGLYVIARPGPYQYSELKNDGLPDWLIDNYPQIKALRFNGTPIGYATVSYLHPLFLEKTKRWFDAIMPVLAKYTTDNGGPVAMIQVDNELTGVQIWQGSIDYNPESMGIGTKGGYYPRFLQQKYKTIQVLNNAYKANCTSFEKVKPIEPKSYNEMEKIRRVKDYYDFYLETVAEYVRTLSGYIRAYTPGVTIIHNSFGSGLNVSFKETVEKMAGTSFMLGTDHYYNLSQTWRQNNPTPQYAGRVFCSLEVLRLFGFPPTVLELPSGSASDWPPPTPRDSRACYYTNLAFGMKGLNYYIFTGGPNPYKYGVTTDNYDYGAPVGATGEIRPLYYVQKEFAEFISQNSWIARAERAYDCRIAIDMEDVRAYNWWKGNGNCLINGNDAHEFMMRGILTTCLSAGLSPKFIDLNQDNWIDDTQTPLLIASSSSMPVSAQTNVIDFIKQGGKVLIAPVIPTLDENLESCNILSDFLGNPEFNLIPGYPRANVGEVKNIFNNGLFAIKYTKTDSNHLLGTEEFLDQPIAVKMDFNKNGCLILLGMKWKYSNREQMEMLKSLLAQLGIKPFIKSDNPNVWFSILKSNQQAMLFAMNLFTDKMTVSPQIKDGDNYRKLDKIEIEPITVKCIELHPN